MCEQELNLLSLTAAIVAQLRAGLLPMRAIRRLSVWRRSDLQQQAGPGQVLETTVWHEVGELLTNPQKLEKDDAASTR